MTMDAGAAGAARARKLSKTLGFVWRPDAQRSVLPAAVSGITQTLGQGAAEMDAGSMPVVRSTAALGRPRTRPPMHLSVRALGHKPRTNLDLVRERRVDGTPVGDFQEARPCGFRHIAFNDDVAGNFSDIAFPGLAVRAILGVNLAVREAHGDAFGV